MQENQNMYLTGFIAIPALLQWSGTVPVIFLRHACTHQILPSWRAQFIKSIGYFYFFKSPNNLLLFTFKVQMNYLEKQRWQKNLTIQILSSKNRENLIH